MKVGVILSGCGVFDGSEIHEAVACLLALDRRGAEIQCLAPEREFEVVDHVTQQPTGELRSVLAESARIARGDVQPLSRVKGGQFDALVLPGGFGAAKNLCTFAVDGPSCELDAETARVLKEAQSAGKPIGFACIAPALAARALGDLGPRLTIGTDASTAAGLEQMGARHVEAGTTEIVTDEANRLVSTPAYMSATRIGEVFDGVDRMVERVLELAGQPVGAA